MYICFVGKRLNEVIENLNLKVKTPKGADGRPGLGEGLIPGPQADLKEMVLHMPLLDVNNIEIRDDEIVQGASKKMYFVSILLGLIHADQCTSAPCFYPHCGFWKETKKHISYEHARKW